MHLLVIYQRRTLDRKATKSDRVTGENRSPSHHDNVERKGKEKAMKKEKKKEKKKKDKEK